MFRTAFAVLLYFSATPPGSAGYSSLTTRDHIQTQLDWRSCYHNRLAVRCRDLLQGTHPQGGPAVDQAS